MRMYRNASAACTGLVLGITKKSKSKIGSRLKNWRGRGLILG